MKTRTIINILLIFVVQSSAYASEFDYTANNALQQAISRGKQHFFYDSFGSSKKLNDKSFTCSTCHAGDSDSGRWPTLINASAIFPLYNPTINKIVTLETQIQRCIKGGIGGTPPAYGSDELVDMLAYLQFIATGQTIDVGGKLLPMPNNSTANVGEQIYNTTCFGCHGTGVAGAPKIGDHKAWAPRIETSLPTLYAHSINGFKGSSGTMPPKGGNSALSDDDVKSAVDYMIKQ